MDTSEGRALGMKAGLISEVLGGHSAGFRPAPVLLVPP